MDGLEFCSDGVVTGLGCRSRGELLRLGLLRLGLLEQLLQTRLQFAGRERAIAIRIQLIEQVRIRRLDQSSDLRCLSVGQLRTLTLTLASPQDGLERLDDGGEIRPNRVVAGLIGRGCCGLLHLGLLEQLLQAGLEFIGRQRAITIRIQLVEEGRIRRLDLGSDLRRLSIGQLLVMMVSTPMMDPATLLALLALKHGQRQLTDGDRIALDGLSGGPSLIPGRIGAGSGNAQSCLPRQEDLRLV